MILKTHSYEVVGVSSKKELLFQLESFEPDLILLDVMLRDGNGRDICKEIRVTNEKVALIIISVNPKFLADYKECGASDAIEKPFDIDDVLKRINFLLQEQQLINKNSL